MRHGRAGYRIFTSVLQVSIEMVGVCLGLPEVGEGGAGLC